jgi:hypothetical protein
MGKEMEFQYTWKVRILQGKERDLLEIMKAGQSPESMLFYKLGGRRNMGRSRDQDLMCTEQA